MKVSLLLLLVAFINLAHSFPAQTHLAPNETNALNGNDNATTEVPARSSRQGRIMNYKFELETNNVTSGSLDFSLDHLSPSKSGSASGSVRQDSAFPSVTSGSVRQDSIYSSGISGSVRPDSMYSSVSYSNPDFTSGGVGGIQPSDLLPYYHDRKSKQGHPVMYQLVPLRKPQPAPEYNFHEAIKDTLYKVKDSVTYGVHKFKNALGFNGFSEKISAPETLLSVAPMAAGLLAGGLAVAYLASRSAGARSNLTSGSPFPFFGRRSARGIMNEEGLNLIVSRLDPVQREYLQKLQLYGPQRWKDTNCAKFIFCDVMSKATPLHIFDMQRKVGVFLSRMDESTARYVEMILKDVMLAIQARDCRRFSCAQTPWGLPNAGHGAHHPFPPFNGHNFLRRH